MNLIQNLQFTPEASDVKKPPTANDSTHHHTHHTPHTHHTTHHTRLIMLVRTAALVVVLTAAVLGTASGSTITLLGVIYGSDGHFCDAFYYSNPLCSGKASCSIPVGNSSVCLKYGTPNPEPVNVMHANWECGSVFMSADLDQGLGDELVLRCPDDDSSDSSDSAAPAPVHTAGNNVFEKAPLVVWSPEDAVAAVPPTIFVLGVVIGSQDVYCDAYFKSAPLCKGKTTCVLPIDASLCSIGHPNPDPTYNYMHVMFSCGENFGRLSVKQSVGSATIACPNAS